MSEIIGGKASFRRVVQPAPYEAAEAMLEYAFTVEPGEDAGQKGAEALALAKRQVLVAVGKASAAPDAPATPAAAEEKAEESKPAKRGRGRPKKEDIMADDDGGDGASAEAEQAEESEEIGDQALQEAAKKAASRVSGAVVRAYLSDKFDGTVQLSKLGQADRAEFIKGLDKLEKPKD